MANLAYERIDSLKLLGVDWTCNETVDYSTAIKQVAKAPRAVNNLRCYAVQATRHINIARADAIGAARYGCTTMGPPPKLLQRIRIMVGSATNTRAKVGSATMDMALQKEKEADLAYMMISAPIKRWATEAYTATDERAKLSERAWF